MLFKFIRSFLLTSTGACSTILLFSSSVMATEQTTIKQISEQTSSKVVQTSSSPIQQILQNGETQLGQVTSVSQLSDVQPTDWAFQALQSLVERYGCIAGYPDRTYRGNRALTRYEFAAGLNACLDRVNELIAAATADLVKKEDLATLQKLQEEFSAELATLRGQVDALEARTTILERQQFSTTTKLTGEVILSFQDVFGDPITPAATDIEPTLANRVRLNFDTSFAGSDRLRVRLQARNITNFSAPTLTGTNLTRLSYDGNENNAFQIDDLSYQFRLGENTRITIAAAQTETFDTVFTFNPMIDSSGSGSLSRFARFNQTIYRGGENGTGIAIVHKLTPQLELSGAYHVPTVDAQDPALERGIFSGSFSALGQLSYQPFENFRLGFSYVRSYFRSGGVNLTGSTGTLLAVNPFGNTATTSDNFGVQATWRVSPGFSVSGWFGYTLARSQARTGAFANDEANILNAALTFAFPDLFVERALGGIIVGIPPYVVDSEGVAALGADTRQDTPIHLEAFYRFPLTDSIDITPGAFVIFNPEGNRDNDPLYVVAIRTTFRF